MPEVKAATKRAVIDNDDPCALCGEGNRPDDTWTVDHIIPVGLGGKHGRGNLRKAHASCNKLLGAELHVRLLERERIALGRGPLLVSIDEYDWS